MRSISFSTIILILLLSCEEVVIIELPTAQNLITVESWLSSIEETQQVKLSVSTGFSSSEQIAGVNDAEVIIQSRAGEIFQFSLLQNGIYQSNSPFAGDINQEYRLRVILSNDEEIRSEWERMQPTIPIQSVRINSFDENDPDNPGEQFTVFFPKVNARDSINFTNNYRWFFYKDRVKYTEPETITIQNDRLFDGNLIPNDFQSYSYSEGEEIIIELQSITQSAFDYLSILKSQITSLGTSTGTTPATVPGNISYQSEEVQDLVLGYFGTVSLSRDTVLVE